MAGPNTPLDDHRDPDVDSDDAEGRGDALVMFGLTGDLGDKKLLPALGELALAGLLEIPVISVSRSAVTVDELRERILASLDDHPGDDTTVEEGIEAIDLRVVHGSVDAAATWNEIAGHVTGSELPVVYAALPPSLFATVAERTATGELPSTTRLVIEKPFGEDEASARRLWDEITDSIDPDRLFVVDHFLAKTAVENLVVVRTRNAAISNNLRPGLVERVDVFLHEMDRVDGRGSFYESVGAVRDVVQNHLLQTVALATMQPDDTDDSFVRARQQLLEAVEPVDPATVTLGQYEGYRELDDVAEDSDVETYASLELSIDVDPWRGVPVRLETGKAMHEQRTAVVYTVRTDDSEQTGRLVFDVSPTPCISIELDVLDGDDHGIDSITVAGQPGEDHGGLGDYATMLRSAMLGDRRHFATIDGILASWRIVDPLLHRRPGLVPYEPASAGPERTD